MRSQIPAFRLPDGSILNLHKVDADYDPYDRVGALNYVQRQQEHGEVVTRLLYVGPESSDCHDALDTVRAPLNKLAENDLCPVHEVLQQINQSLR